MVIAGTVMGIPRGDGGLPRRDLPDARGENLPHDHVLDLLRRYTGLLECGLDRDTAEVGCGEVLQTAEHATDRGPGTGHDDRSGHVFAFLTSPASAGTMSSADPMNLRGTAALPFHYDP